MQFIGMAHFSVKGRLKMEEVYFQEEATHAFIRVEDAEGSPTIIFSVPVMDRERFLKAVDAFNSAMEANNV